MKKSIWTDKIVFITGGSSGIGLAVEYDHGFTNKKDTTAEGK